MTVDNNHQRFCRHSLSVTAKKLEVRLVETHGEKEKRIYAVDIY
jgi:hypothetical protein